MSRFSEWLAYQRRYEPPTYSIVIGVIMWGAIIWWLTWVYWR
jgi:hypothetical protein